LSAAAQAEGNHLRRGRGRDEEEGGERAKHLMVAQSIKMDFDEDASSRRARVVVVNASL
jgi:hypothetical protein